MKEIKVKDIVNLCEGKLLCGNEDETIQNFKKDTREIENRRYLCTEYKEKTLIGSDFFEKAFENGAKATILENIEIKEEVINKYKNKVIIIVEDTIKALQKIATYKRDEYNIPIIGVTGSVRKN